MPAQTLLAGRRPDYEYCVKPPHRPSLFLASVRGVILSMNSHHRVNHGFRSLPSGTVTIHLPTGFNIAYTEPGQVNQSHFEDV